MLILAATVIVIAGIKSASPIVNYFLLSLFLALISATPVFWLQRKGLPIIFGVTLVSMVIIVGIGATTLMLSSAVAGFSARLPEYQTSLQEHLAPLRAWLQVKGVEFSGPTLFPGLNPENILGMVMTLLGNIGSIVSNIVLILLTVTFLLLDTAGFQHRLRRLSSDPAMTMQRFTDFADNIRHYLVLKTWLSLATALGVGLWVALLGLDFPLIWALLAFFFNFIPNIGSILAAIPAVVLALVQLGPTQAILVALGYLLINFLIGNGLEPRVMGRGVGLPTSVVFLALIFWGWVLGPVGMILSVPLTVMVKMALESSADTSWLALLLSSDESAEKPG